MKRGWCPGLYDPMPSGDGLLVRVRPPGARLTADAARALAAASRSFGNGVIEATSRGNLQVRGLRAEGVPGFAAAMVAAGLADPDPAVDKRRCVIVAPLAGDDPSAIDVTGLAAEIEAALAGVPRLADKFAVAVDGGGVLPLVIEADVVVRGSDMDAVNTVRRLAIMADGQRLATRHREARSDSGLPTLALDSPGLPRREAAARNDRGVGYVRYPGSRFGAFGIGLPFGQTNAATIDRLAALAERFSGGTLRVSPWRSLFFGRVRAEASAALHDAIIAAGLLASPADPRLRISACIGSDGCASGTVPARRDAADLAAGTWAGVLHVSGCAKGCAHPGPAAVTLVGEAGGYGLVRQGRAGDTPVARGSAAQLMALA